MLHKGRTLVMALGLVMAGVVSAEAFDLCVSDHGSVFLVGKKFKIPPRNQCKPFNGFSEGGAFFVTGTGCTRADGAFFRLQFTANSTSGHELASAFCGIPLPSLSGGTCVSLNAVASGNFEQTTTDISAQPCIVNVP